MNDVTQVLQRIEIEGGAAADEMLPLVDDQLRRMAASRMVGERPDHTLSATALVHEAYVRLVDSPQERSLAYGSNACGENAASATANVQ